MANARVQAHIWPSGTVTDNARRIVRARLAELYVWAQYAHDESRLSEQHQMRIAAKRLRYTLELFRDYLPEQTDECIKTLKGLQDALGLLHDCDVLIAILRSALFAPDDDAALFAAVPEARTLPPALLDVLGQQPDTSKQGKRGKHAQAGKRPRAQREAKAGRRKHAARLAEAARSAIQPDAAQRAALEHFYTAQAPQRANLYRQFVRRWDKMEEGDFRAAVLHLAQGAETAGRFHAHPLAAQAARKRAQHS